MATKSTLQRLGPSVPRLATALIAAALVSCAAPAFAAVRTPPRGLRRVAIAAALALGLSGCQSPHATRIELGMAATGGQVLLEAAADSARNPVLREGLRALANAWPSLLPAAPEGPAVVGNETIRLKEDHGWLTVYTTGAKVTFPARLTTTGGVTINIDR